MNRTISVALYNKPKTSLKTLSYIINAKHFNDFKLYIFIDHNGTDDLINLAKAFQPQDIIIANPPHTNYRMQHFLNQAIFEKYSSDWNVHIDDDEFIGPDALWYFLQVEKYLYPNSDLGVASLFANAWSKGCSKATGFTSTYGTYWSKSFHFSHFTQCGWANRERIYPYGWDIALDARMRAEGLFTLRSDVPRCKNHGMENPTHSQAGFPDQGIHWTGEGYLPFQPITPGVLKQYEPK